ncbi:hypothetical protein BASA81_010363, partial [Batrachochytrium salamandrivorans]
MERKFDWTEIEVISFDLDDTLWHCEPVLVKAELALRQFWLDRGHVEMHRGLTAKAMVECANQVRLQFPHKSGDVSFIRIETLKLLAAQHCQFTSQAELDLTCQLAFDEFFHHRTLHVSDHFFPGSLDALRRIRNLGLRVGTISNGNAQVDKIPELMGLVECHVSPALHPVLAKPWREPFDLLRVGLGNVTFTGHTGKVCTGRFTDNNCIISGSHDRTIKIWDLVKGYCVKTIFTLSSCNDLALFGGEGEVIVSGHLDNNLRIWDARTGNNIREITGIHSGQITNVEILPNSLQILTTSRDNTLQVLDVRTYKAVATYA